MTTMVPAVYENGAFQVLTTGITTDLPEGEEVSLFYVSTNDQFIPVDLNEEPMDIWDKEMEAEFGSEPQTAEERIAFMHKTTGLWPIQDEETREWIDNLSVYNDGTWLPIS